MKPDLSDGQSLVQITKCVNLPLLTLHGNVELPDTLKGQLFLLDEDPDGVPHEPSGHLKHLLGHGGGQQDDLKLANWLNKYFADGGRSDSQ